MLARKIVLPAIIAIGCAATIETSLIGALGASLADCSVIGAATCIIGALLAIGAALAGVFLHGRSDR